MRKQGTYRYIVATVAAIVLSIATTGKASGQRIHAFVSSGVAISQIEGDELKGFNKFGYTGGVGALTSIGGQWGLSIEVSYTRLGAYNKTGDPYSINLTLPYAEIPLMLHYQDPYGGMLFGAGLCYGRLVGQPHNVMKYNPNYFVPDTTDFSFLYNDIAAVVDARFSITRRLQLDLRYQASIVAVKRDWLFSEYVQGRWEEHTRNCYNHSIIVKLIYQF